MSVSDSRKEGWDCVWEARISWTDARGWWQGCFIGLVYLMAPWPLSYSKKWVLLFHICCIIHDCTFTKLWPTVSMAETSSSYGRSHKMAPLQVRLRCKTGLRDQNPKKLNVEDQTRNFRLPFRYCLDLQALWWELHAFPSHALPTLHFSQMWLETSCSASLHIITLGILMFFVLSEHTYNIPIGLASSSDAIVST